MCFANIEYTKKYEGCDDIKAMLKKVFKGYVETEHEFKKALAQEKSFKPFG